MMPGLLRHLSTLRHGRGFGVHSPLAYELISAVLRDRPAYYGDANIKLLYKCRRQRRTARVILRLIARFEPKTVYCHPLYAPVVSLAGSTICLIKDDDKADMTVQIESGHTIITIGQREAGFGPLILDNENDLKIIIYRAGLSPTLINTTL